MPIGDEKYRIFRVSDITQPSLIAIRYVLPSLKLRTVTYAVYFLAVFSLAACSQPNPTAIPSPGSESASLSVTALTASHVPIDAAEPTATASIPPSPSAVPTNTAEPTATATVPPSPSAVPTNTAEPTATVTVPPSPSAVPTNTAEPMATATVPPSPSPVPTNTAEPTATAAVPPATLGDKSPAEVYALVAPSVPFIETAAGTGSGILIEGDTLSQTTTWFGLTNLSGLSSLMGQSWRTCQLWDGIQWLTWRCWGQST